jgi:hypothetical protein
MQKKEKSTEGMSFADDVRNYCLGEVEKARIEGKKQISFRAGDVHNTMGYKNRLPLVCAAIGAKKFENLACVERTGYEGPSNGANAVFTFKIREK